MRPNHVAGSLLLSALIVAAGLLWPHPADARCEEDDTALLDNLLENPCWDCFFPISLASVSINPDDTGEKDTVPAVGPGLPFPKPNPWPPPMLCSCKCIPLGEVSICLPGLPLGYWEPANLIEVVRTPFCFPSLGKKLDDSSELPADNPLTAIMFNPGEKQSEHGDNELNHSFYHVHFMLFPLFRVVGILTDILCLDLTGVIADSLDILYLSELDPLWHDDLLTALVFPETVLINNPIAAAACIADAVAAQFDFPLDPLFWCAGTWGSIYPPTGNMAGRQGDIKGSALVWTRLLHRLARFGIEWYTAGNALLLCWDFPTGTIVKSQYKFQLLWPVPNEAPGCCSSIGKSTLRWGTFKTIPVTGEDHVFLLWKLKRCCFM